MSLGVSVVCVCVFACVVISVNYGARGNVRYVMLVMAICRLDKWVAVHAGGATATVAMHCCCCS
eukprot:9470813-Pyramimonas_sp.AAC.1